MAEPPLKPVLQKPPGYRDPNVPLRPGPRPPGKPVLPTTMYPRKKRRHCCRMCCCVFCCLLLILILVLIIAVGVLYLWFDPAVPVFHLESFEFPRFNITNKADGSYLDAATAASVEVKNPNEKLGVYYGKTHVEISLSGSDGSDIGLGSDDLPGFGQSAKNVTNLKVATRVSNELVGPNVLSGYQSKSLGVKVEVRSSVGLSVNGWKTGTIGVNVECGGVTLKKIAAGNAPKCFINLLKWINIH